MIRFPVSALTLMVLFTATPRAETQNSVAESARSILDSHCITCHGEAAMSALDLRTRNGILRGGNRGPAIVPGNSAGSLLIRAIRREGDLKMPPGDAALSPSQVRLVAGWIDAGAEWREIADRASTRAWWSFQGPTRPAVPAVSDHDRVRNPVDAFVLAKLEERGLELSPPANRATLARRAYFDLHGLPPSAEDVRQFVEDESDDAFEQLVDRLLESDRYGERWGRYWLDLVRYADTSGFETDHYYTTAWRYRDYVIESFNRDKPYSTFVREQIAADELWPVDTDLEGTLNLSPEKRRNMNRRVGTSLFTLGAFPIEYTYYGDLYRAEWSAEAVDLIGAAFLGLTLECARCHDHKSDPISQRDYYRLAAFFAGSAEREIPLGSLFDVQTSTRSFPLLEHARALKRMAKQSKGLDEQQRRKMLERLGKAYLAAPEPLPTAKVLGHEASVPATFVLAHGDFKKRGERVDPGFPAAIAAARSLSASEIARFPPRRRAALAQWLTSEDHPLVGRVMVNRIWQHHFGAGLVRTPNDFGRQGDPPTHPLLLDWLAAEFAERGWSVKQMHRLIMLSSVYRASSLASERGMELDPDNRYLGRMNRRRLDADAIRDSVLNVSGSLNLKMGGVGVIPPLTGEEILAARMPHLWPAHPDPGEHARRSVYLQVKRSMSLPMLQIFDAPDTSRSCARRESSTVAPQALAMMNSDFALREAQAFAERLRRETDGRPESLVNAGWLLAMSRSPTSLERRTALDYLARNSLADLCRMLFNLNEFIYVD